MEAAACCCDLSRARHLEIEFSTRRQTPGNSAAPSRTGGTSPPLNRVDELSRVVTDVMTERGTPCAGAAARRHQSRIRGRDAVFTVEPGAHLIVRLKLSGMPSVSREELLKRSSRSGEPYQQTPWPEHRPVNRRAAEGYYEAQFTVRPAIDEDVANLTWPSPPAPIRLVFAGDALPSDRRDEVRARSEGRWMKIARGLDPAVSKSFSPSGYGTPGCPHAEAGRPRAGDYIHGAARAVRVARHRRGIPRCRSPSREQHCGRARRCYPKAPYGQTTIERLYRGRAQGRRVQADSKAIRHAARPSGARAEGIGIIEACGRSLAHPDRGQCLRVGDGAAAGPGAAARDPYLMRGFAEQIRSRRQPRLRSATVEPQAGFTADHAQANPVFVVRKGRALRRSHSDRRPSHKVPKTSAKHSQGGRCAGPVGGSGKQRRRRPPVIPPRRRLPSSNTAKRRRETARHRGRIPPTTLKKRAGLEGRLRVPGTISGRRSRFEVAPRTRRLPADLFGRNRSINLFGSISLHPPDVSTSSISGWIHRVGRSSRFTNRASSTRRPTAGDRGHRAASRSSFNLARKSITAQVPSVIARLQRERLSVPGHAPVRCQCAGRAAADPKRVHAVCCRRCRSRASATRVRPSGSVKGGTERDRAARRACPQVGGRVLEAFCRQTCVCPQPGIVFVGVARRAGHHSPGSGRDRSTATRLSSISGIYRRRSGFLPAATRPSAASHSIRSARRRRSAVPAFPLAATPKPFSMPSCASPCVAAWAS